MPPIKRKDTRRGRFYEVDGEHFPSVTSILSILGKPALIAWAAREERNLVSEAAAELYEELQILAEPLEKKEFIERLISRLGDAKAHRRLLKEAQDIGTQVHKRIEWEIRSELGLKVSPEPPVLKHPKAENSFSRWREWREAVKMKPLASEQKIYSVVFKFAGTLDLLAEVDDPELGPGVEVIDFKTGKYIYGEAFLQNGGYRLALKEMGIENDRGRIVRLPKEADDPEFETQIVPPLEKVAVPFLSLLPVWRWHKEQEDRFEERKKREREERRADSDGTVRGADINADAA